MPPCKLYFRCFLLIPALYAAASWDVAVLNKDEIDFIYNGTSIGTIGGRLKELQTASYDPIDGFLYVSDSNQKNASIFRINLFRSYEDPCAVSFQSVVTKKRSVNGLAFEPVTATLFWTTGYTRTIMKWTANRSKSPNAVVPTDGEVVHNFKTQIPHGIAVDSCRRTLYWTNMNPRNATIERSTLDGSDRRTIIDNDLHLPTSVEVDERQGKIYWCDSRGEGYSYRIERSDLDGTNREIMMDGHQQSPLSITVGLDHVYWTEREKGEVWLLSKKSVGGVEPTPVRDYRKGIGDIVSSSLFAQVDPTECRALAPLTEQLAANSRKEAAILKHLPLDVVVEDSKEQRCLNNGTMRNGKCVCGVGFRGDFCEISVCQNYCVSGVCEVSSSSSSGKPSCKCQKGWTGKRCEVERCHGVCLNNGKCKLLDDERTRCECEYGFSGARCEVQSTLMHEFCRWYCVHNQGSTKLRYRVSAESSSEVDRAVINSETCKCSEIPSVTDRDDESVSSPIRKNESPLVTELGGRTSAVICTLGALCVILGVLTVYLAAQVLTLKKRPRIRKRYVVNKSSSSAPFTCRPQPPPEQCEITIENCCNMNICETPCFEPEFKTSKATFNKTKSEDKRTLIGSMHTNSSQEEDNY